MSMLRVDLSELFTPGGYVYLARALNFYKIGISKDPEVRIKHFSTVMPVDVVIEHVFQAENPKAAEDWLHKVCAPWRYKGEWFLLPPEMVDLVCSVVGHRWQRGPLYFGDRYETAAFRWLNHFIDNRKHYPELDYLPY